MTELPPLWGRQLCGVYDSVMGYARIVYLVKCEPLQCLVHQITLKWSNCWHTWAKYASGLESLHASLGQCLPTACSFLEGAHLQTKSSLFSPHKPYECGSQTCKTVSKYTEQVVAVKLRMASILHQMSINVDLFEWWVELALSQSPSQKWFNGLATTTFCWYN